MRKQGWVSISLACNVVNTCTHPELDAIICILILNDGLHLESMLESTGDVEGRLAGLDAALDTGTAPLTTQNTYKRPTTLLWEKNKIEVRPHIKQQPVDKKTTCINNLTRIHVTENISEMKPNQTFNDRWSITTWCYLSRVHVKAGAWRVFWSYIRPHNIQTLQVCNVQNFRTVIPN